MHIWRVRSPRPSWRARACLFLVAQQEHSRDQPRMLLRPLTRAAPTGYEGRCACAKRATRSATIACCCSAHVELFFPVPQRFNVGEQRCESRQCVVCYIKTANIPSKRRKPARTTCTIAFHDESCISAYNLLRKTSCKKDSLGNLRVCTPST